MKEATSLLVATAKNIKTYFSGNMGEYQNYEININMVTE